MAKGSENTNILIHRSKIFLSEVLEHYRTSGARSIFQKKPAIKITKCSDNRGSTVYRDRRVVNVYKKDLLQIYFALERGVFVSFLWTFAKEKDGERKGEIFQNPLSSTK